MNSTFVCASSCIKHVQSSYGCRGTPVCVRKNYLIHKILLQKVLEIKTKNIFLNEQKVGMLLQKRTNTRGVGISSMRKSIYLLTTTPTSHTHLLLTTPTSHTHTFHPLFTIVILTLNLCKVQARCPKMITTVQNEKYSERSFLVQIATINGFPTFS